MATDVEQEPSAEWRGKVGYMDTNEVDAFLAEGNLARLAVLDDNGWPYIQPIWYQWDPEQQVFWIVARQKSVWATFLKNDGRAALSIDGNTKPYKKVSVQGTAEIVEEPNVGGQWVPMAEKMAGRYLAKTARTTSFPRWTNHAGSSRSPDHHDHLAGGRLASAVQEPVTGKDGIGQWSSEKHSTIP